MSQETTASRDGSVTRFRQTGERCVECNRAISAETVDKHGPEYCVVCRRNR